MVNSASLLPEDFYSDEDSDSPFYVLRGFILARSRRRFLTRVVMSHSIRASNFQAVAPTKQLSRSIAVEILAGQWQSPGDDGCICE